MLIISVRRSIFEVAWFWVGELNLKKFTKNSTRFASNWCLAQIMPERSVATTATVVSSDNGSF